jgi:hypothetical protein
MGGWLKYLESQKRSGRIRDFKVQEKKTGNVIPQKESKELSWIKWNLWYWCNEHSLEIVEEYRFDEKRKWRFDFYLPALKLGIEYNGIMSEKSRHTTIGGYSGDMEKINAAQGKGIRVLQYTPLNYRNMIRDLEKIIN